MTDRNSPMTYSQLTTIGGHAETTSIEVARHFGVSHDELVAAIESHLAEDSEYNVIMQKDGLNRSTQLFTRYRMTADAVLLLAEFIRVEETNARAKEIVEAMEAAEDAKRHLSHPVENQAACF